MPKSNLDTDKRKMYIDNPKEGIKILKEKVVSTEYSQKKEPKRTPKAEIDYSSYNDKIISNSNNYFLVKVLSPQIEANEETKRKHKQTMLNIIVLFLKVQFIMLFLLVAGTLITFFVFHGLHNDISNETFKIIIGFLGVYITSIVVELIYIAKFIVVNVFDTSIDGLVKLFSNADVNLHKDLDNF